jgi:hypothetical protein
VSDGEVLHPGASGGGAVHVSWKAAALFGLLAVRSLRLLARLHSHVAAVQAVTRVPCAAFECEQLITPAPLNDGFCNGCRARLLAESKELLDDVTHVLDLEAQFVEFCVSRGLPHPHD